MHKIVEPARNLDVVNQADVVVCGGGPAGIAASIAAARKGAKTVLLEAAGNLGGIWTSGLLPHVMGYCEQDGLITEIKESFQKAVDVNPEVPKTLPSPEAIKLIVERMCLDAGVEIFLYSKVCNVQKEGDSITHVIVESPDGRRAFGGKMFIDCTGNGDLGAQAGCGYDVGREEDGVVQPLSLIALVTGLDYNDVKDFVSGSEEAYNRLHDEFVKCGIEPSYSRTSMIRVSDDVYLYAGNHQYNVPCTDTVGMTRATIEARAEIHNQINALRSVDKRWRNVKIVATASQIGIRDGRRLHGLYTMRLDDLKNGRVFPDAVCKVKFGVDVHALSSDSNRGLTGISKANPVKPYDIPLRALISSDCDNLLMAGRCISGDFYAHASYRVTGISVPCGEAAGLYAVKSIKQNRSLNTLVEEILTMNKTNETNKIKEMVS